MKTSTLGEELKKIFSKFSSEITAATQNENVYSIWNRVLGGDGRSAGDVFESLGYLMAALNKLEQQIFRSSDLDEDSKATAHQTVQVFKSFFSIERLAVQAREVQPLCKQNLGALGLLGGSLKREFHEPTLDTEDSSILISALTEIRDLVNSDSIPKDLSINLLSHINFLLWWLNRPDLIGAQTLLERTGAALCVASQIKHREATSDEESNSIASKIFDGLNHISIKLLIATEYAFKNPEKVLAGIEILRLSQKAIG